jgi:hypothetical protein
MRPLNTRDIPARPANTEDLLDSLQQMIGRPLQFEVAFKDLNKAVHHLDLADLKIDSAIVNLREFLQVFASLAGRLQQAYGLGDSTVHFQGMKRRERQRPDPQLESAWRVRAEKGVENMMFQWHLPEKAKVKVVIDDQALYLQPKLAAVLEQLWNAPNEGLGYDKFAKALGLGVHALQMRVSRLRGELAKQGSSPFLVVTVGRGPDSRLRLARRHVPFLYPGDETRIGT